MYILGTSLEKSEARLEIAAGKALQNGKVGKTEALSRPKEVQAFLRNRSLFKINDDGILMRLWHTDGGEITALIVVGAEKMKAIIKDTHSGISSPNKHAGRRRTFQCLTKRYFCFSLRKLFSIVSS